MMDKKDINSDRNRSTENRTIASIGVCIDTVFPYR